MKYIAAFTLFTSIYITTFAQKQSHLVLQHRKNQIRFKELSINEFYKIKTIDTIINSEILKFTDSTFSIIKIIKIDINAKYSKHGSNKLPDKNYYEDTIVIKFSDVQYIKIDWFKKRDFIVLPAYLAFGSTAGIPLVAIASLVESGKVDLETLAIVASISIISWSIIFIATRQRKYDIQKNWILTTRE